MSDEVRGLIPTLTRLFVKSVWGAAEWATEMFISYCEIIIRAAVRTSIAVIAAIVLYKLSIQLQINLLLIVSIVVGGFGLLYFAAVSSFMRMGANWLTKLSDTAREEIEMLSKIMMTLIVVIVYCSVNQPINHPVLLSWFLGLLVILYVVSILPGKGRFVSFCHQRYQWLVLVPLVLMTMLSIAPEAIMDRIINSHGLQKATGTVAEEIPYHIDNQDQIIDDTTNRPMDLFDQIADKNTNQPRPLKGWTQDRNNSHYRLYKWFAGQNNFTPSGKKIEPVTVDKVDVIVTQGKREIEEKVAATVLEPTPTAAITDTKPKTDNAKLQADTEQNLKAQQVTEETLRQQQVQHETEARERVEAERQARETAQVREAEAQRLDSQPIQIWTKIQERDKRFASEDTIIVRPDNQFTYRDQVRETLVYPDKSFLKLNITDVKEGPKKDTYLLVLQPQRLLSDGEDHDISRRTDLIQISAKKDNPHSIWKVLGGAGAGAGIGALLNGRDGAVAGAVTGTVAGAIYATMTSHGHKFQVPIGQPVEIRLKPLNAN